MMIDLLRRSRRFALAAAIVVGAATAAMHASAGGPSPGAGSRAPGTANGAASAAASGPEATVRAAVEQWLQGRYKIESVRRSPVAGIFEVQIGNDLIYVDEKGQYGFVEGQLVEFKGNRNLTQERLDELNTIAFKDLPLDLAIKQVIGKGTRVVAVFEDPNCPHCRTLRRELVNIPDLTIYTFPYPILTPESELKSRQAWCAPDRTKAWNELVLQNKLPANDGTCKAPIDRVLELGRKLRVTGTPTIFFQNGRRIPGSVPAARLIKLIEENSKS
jgi:thiol:disulfide interchange protein DsbC